jgi:hypothetical protein
MSERIRRERELEEYRRWSETLVEHFPAGGVALVDEEMRYVTFGGQPETDSELSRADLEGALVSEVLPEQLADVVLPGYEGAFSGEAVEFEASIDGRTYQYYFVPVRDDDGEVFAATAMSLDVTERTEREQRLERQREQLAAINSLNAVVSDITDAVIEQSTREQIEDAIVEGLATAESFAFAWIGEVDGSTEEVALRTEAGVDGYLDGVTITTDPDDGRSQGPTGQALLTGETQVSQDVTTDSGHASWRDHVAVHDVGSSAAIPIVDEGITYGVLNVYADRPHAFETAERRILTQLGEVAGHAIAAVERKRALMSDEVVELEFRIPDVLAVLGIDGDAEGHISLDQAVPAGDGSYLVYGTATAEARPVVDAFVAALPHWKSVTDVSDRGDVHRFEAHLSEPPVLSVVAARGGYVDEAVIEDGDYHMVIHMPPTVEVRSIIAAVTDEYPDATLVAQRQYARSAETDVQFERLLYDELTERQRAAVRVAFHAGYFEWPRQRDGAAIAESLNVSPPTFHQHLRKAEGKVFEALLTGTPSADTTVPG